MADKQNRLVRKDRNDNNAALVNDDLALVFNVAFAYLVDADIEDLAFVDFLVERVSISSR